MIGVIHDWRVRPGREAEHAGLFREILDEERRSAPEVLLLLGLGPSPEGVFAEVQLFPSEEAFRLFPARAEREAPRLAELCKRHDETCEPGSLRTVLFEADDFAPRSFVRGPSTLGHGLGRGPRLQDKVALVTGAHRGNGLGIALAFAREGASVVLADLSLDLLGPAREQVEALGARCACVSGDVGRAEDVERLVSEAASAFGGLDVLVNNAGVFPFKPIEEFSPEEFARVLQVNLAGPWLLSRACLKYFRARGGGAIVNITSCSGHEGGASPGGSAYDASKGGLRQLTASLAVELGPLNVRANAIAPGVVATEAQGGEGLAETEWGRFEIARTPLRRLGRAADVGRVAVFLASEDSSYVNGATIILDGGAMAAW